MDIAGTGRLDRTRAAAKARSATGTAAGGFTLAAGDTPQPTIVRGAAPLAALDSILALQGVEDATAGRSKGLARGQQLLEVLDELREGLLTGTLPRATLHRLAGAVSARTDQFSDPQLQPILDEIELRAQVELAKLEMAEPKAA